MNILITSAGRRTYMVEYFKEALGGEGLVYAANSELSPALRAADGYFITPLIYDEEYIPFLLTKCLEFGIDMLLSLFDPDLPVLARHRAEFEAIGVYLAVSDIETVDTANDKLRMYEVFKAHGIAVPETAALLSEAFSMLGAGKLCYPLIVKPRLGMGSVGVMEAHSEEELRGAYGMCLGKIESTYLRYEARGTADSPVIIEERIPGPEYGLDIVSDLEGEFITVFARRKLSMRAGETDAAVTLGEGAAEYGTLCALGERIARILRPRGLIDADVIVDDRSGRAYVIDINARFGGGYPFSHLAGADVPGAYVLLMEGRRAEALSRLKTAEGIAGYKDMTVRRAEL